MSFTPPGWCNVLFHASHRTDAYSGDDTVAFAWSRIGGVVQAEVTVQRNLSRSTSE